MRVAACRRRLAVAGMIVALCAASLSACGRRPSASTEPERVHLPGFSIEVLPGRVESTSEAQSDGRHVIKLRKPDLFQTYFWKVIPAGTLSISWSSQAYSREDWQTLLLPTFIKTLDASTKPGNVVLKEAAAGEQRWMYIIGTQGFPLGIGVINCDPSFAITVTLAHIRDIEREFAELKHLVDSVHCEVTAANTTRPLAATRLPEKFGYTPELEYQMFQSLDGEQLVVNFTSSDVQRDPTVYRHVIHALISQALGADIDESQIELLPEGEPRPAGKSSLMRARVPTSNGKLYVGTQYCPKIGLSLISFWEANDSTDALARERQSQLGCPGESSTPTQDFASLAIEACNAGDARFCGLQEMPE